MTRADKLDSAGTGVIREEQCEAIPMAWWNIAAADAIGVSLVT